MASGHYLVMRPLIPLLLLSLACGGPQSSSQPSNPALAGPLEHEVDGDAAATEVARQQAARERAAIRQEFYAGFRVHAGRNRKLCQGRQGSQLSGPRALFFLTLIHCFVHRW